MNRDVLYAWKEGSKWCLSWFKKESGKAKNTYLTQAEVVTEAQKRGKPIEWQQ